MRYFEQHKPRSTPRRRRGKRAKRPEDSIHETQEAVVARSHILLLSGPPGCGKSTLVRIAAARCGFHVVELNASEDVKVERNQVLLQNQLDFEPVFGRGTRPLLLLEELDGIGSIADSILRAVAGLKGRPVVLAVNDQYAPALRALRTQAQVLRMPLPPVSKFVARLKRVAELEGISITAQALAELAESSRLDLRTALNTLQFVALRQPVTAEMLQLTPVGIKNATLSPFDVWAALFLQSTRLEDMLRMLESFGDVGLAAIGALENCESIRSADPTGHKMANLLDDLCFADCAYGEVAALGLAGIPPLHGTSRVGARHLVFPSSSFGREAQQRKNEAILAKNLRWRDYRDLFDLYVNPSAQIASVLTGRTGQELRQRFVEFHKFIKLAYKKNDFGHYMADPDVDLMLDFDMAGGARLTKFRELIQHELEKQQSVNKTVDLTITDKLHRRVKKKKPNTPVDFWGQNLPSQPTQYTLDPRPPLFYKYNEGFTNAVLRPVYLARILAVPT
jgi:chromosome transmission fidelity protein 18